MDYSQSVVRAERNVLSCGHGFASGETPLQQYETICQWKHHWLRLAL